MRKLILLAVVALFSALLVGPAPQAQAASFVTPNNCISYADITQCVQVKWRKQADGDGVTLEGYWMDTTNGCSSLNARKWYDGQVMWVNTDTGANDRTYNMGEEPCNQYNDLEDEAGQDSGPMDFRIAITADRNNAADRRFLMGWTVRATGTSTLRYEMTLAP